VNYRVGDTDQTIEVTDDTAEEAVIAQLKKMGVLPKNTEGIALFEGDNGAIEVNRCVNGDPPDYPEDGFSLILRP
jgi:hypothetical protein